METFAARMARLWRPSSYPRLHYVETLALRTAPLSFISTASAP